MTTTGFAPGIYSAQRNSKLYVSLRSQLDDLQRQLYTGQRATTYGGLGVGRYALPEAPDTCHCTGAWQVRIPWTMEAFAKP